jgi:hypothetical protein
MQNANLLSRPHALSNGALALAVSLHSFMYLQEMDKTLHGNCACTQPELSVYRTGLTGKPSAPFDRALHFGLQI